MIDTSGYDIFYEQFKKAEGDYGEGAFTEGVKSLIKDCRRALLDTERLDFLEHEFRNAKGFMVGEYFGFGRSVITHTYPENSQGKTIREAIDKAMEGLKAKAE